MIKIPSFILIRFKKAIFLEIDVTFINSFAINKSLNKTI